MKFIRMIIIALLIVVVGFAINEYVIKDIIYPIKYNNIIEKVAKEYNIDKYLICAIIKVESNFNEKAVSSSGAKGLMQIMDNTAVEVGNILQIDNFETDMLYNPEINIQIGVKYFSMLYNKYEDNRLALIAYNAGQGNLDSWIKEEKVTDEQSCYNLPFKETTAYWQKVMREYNIYSMLY